MIFDTNYCGGCKHFIGGGDFSLCCDIKDDLCYKHTKACENYVPIEKLTEKEFIERFCHNCGSQRCEGIGTEWFDGCKFKDFLENN